MYKQCQRDQSSARQRQLEQGLLQIMLKNHYDEISVSTLCDALQIPRKSFYRYFSGKDGALYALIDHALMEYEVETTRPEFKDYSEPLQYMIGVFSYWVSNRPLLDALQRSGLSGLLVQRALEYARDMDTLPEFMQITDRRLREYGTMFTVCGLMTMIVQWHHDGFSKSVEEMAKLSIELFTKPLFSLNSTLE